MPITEPVQKFLYTPFGEAYCDSRWLPDNFDMPVNYSCWMIETRENWYFPQQLVRACESMSFPAHGQHSPIHLSDELFETYRHHILRHKKSPFYERAADSSRQNQDVQK